MGKKKVREDQMSQQNWARQGNQVGHHQVGLVELEQDQGLQDRVVNMYLHLGAELREESVKVCQIGKEEMLIRQPFVCRIYRKTRKKGICRNYSSLLDILQESISQRIRSLDNARVLHLSTITRRTMQRKQLIH